MTTRCRGSRYTAKFRASQNGPVDIDEWQIGLAFAELNLFRMWLHLASAAPDRLYDVGTETDLEDRLKSEVIEFSASGFRDFTRIAASDPVMWRDIFLNNREAVLEILQRFNEDLTALQRAIRWGEGDKLHELFTRTRAIRRPIIEAKQALICIRHSATTRGKQNALRHCEKVSDSGSQPMRFRDQSAPSHNFTYSPDFTIRMPRQGSRTSR